MTKGEIGKIIENVITFSDYEHLVAILFANYTEREIHKILKSYIRQNGDGEYDLLITSITECLPEKQYIDEVIKTGKI